MSPGRAGWATWLPRALTWASSLLRLKYDLPNSFLTPHQPPAIFPPTLALLEGSKKGPALGLGVLKTQTPVRP